MKTSSILFSTNQVGDLIEQFLPASLELRVHQVTVASDELTLVLASSPSDVGCPLCGQASARVHSRYMRTLQDLPWGALRVRLRIQVHRFFCQNPICARRIFTEPLADLAEPYARRTTRLREALLTTGWADGVGKQGHANVRPLRCPSVQQPCSRCCVDAEQQRSQRLGFWEWMIGPFKLAAPELCW